MPSPQAKIDLVIARADAIARESRNATQATAVAQEAICLKCYGSGFVRADLPLGDPNFGKAIPCECKEKEFAQIRRRRYQRLSDILPENDAMTFEKFEARRHPAGLKAAQDFVSDPHAPPFLLLEGPTGTGKTHLLSAIYHTLQEREQPVILKVVPKLLDWLRAGFNPKKEDHDETFETRFGELLKVEWLLLDDLGAQQNTAWALDKLFQIVNERYMSGLPTAFTTNIELEDMDDRIRSRLGDWAVTRQVSFIKLTDYRTDDVNAPIRQKQVRRKRVAEVKGA